MTVSFTIDLEDPTELYNSDGRYVVMTQHILDFCDQIGCKATFFTVGRIAESAPQLIRDISKRGHEIAYHSHAHVPLTEENPDRFLRESQNDKKLLEELSGQPVVGFRAPRFSLTPETKWILDILVDLGFKYSSSIMPTSASLYGFKEAPTKPFRWPNGLVEFPLPVAKMGASRIPYLGGIYLYALPVWVAHHWLSKAEPEEVLWTYTHPYDFDRQEPFKQMPHTALWVSAVLWFARRVAEGKIRSLLKLGTAGPLGNRIPKNLGSQTCADIDS